MKETDARFTGNMKVTMKREPKDTHSTKKNHVETLRDRTITYSGKFSLVQIFEMKKL